ncbi:DUF4236 domain-containing protein [Bacillus marasmi]|uniref:DUF4236 domain-containing protein n=1 Tax=Bacillus marasmi TaxID=1926279 RepID=UPI0011CC8E79|nr:DUF4236 domain-containing protein [Bacillus marasmi]
MGLRFRKSFKIAPGIRMNVGKKGVGVSFGGKGLRYSIHSSGKRTATAGIPGSGLYYTSSTNSRSYKTDAYKRKSELNRRIKEQQKLEQLEYARLQVDLFENRLDQIKSIHDECDDQVDWDEVSNRRPPFEKGQVGPNERKATQALNDYIPGFFDRLFKKDQRIIQRLKEEVNEAIQKDAELYEEWQRMVTIAKRMVAHDIDAYFEVIEEFGPLDDLVEFGSGFEFGTDQEDSIHVSFDVNAENVIPEKVLSLTKTGKLSEKAMAKTRYFDLCQDYVCGCSLRIARDMFALLPIKYVFVHAYDNKMNTATGHQERESILSVKFDKPTLNSLNFSNLDPSDALSNFKHNMNFKKTKGFEEVEVITS